jgi:hypothetical protein
MHHLPLWKLLTQYYAASSAKHQPLTILCERFEFRKEEEQREKIDYIAKEYEGVVKLFSRMNLREEDLELVMQGASYTVGKTAFWGDGPEGNDRIKSLGLWQPGRKHALDALRHYLFYVSFTLRDNQFINKLPRKQKPVKANGLYVPTSIEGNIVVQPDGTETVRGIVIRSK